MGILSTWSLSQAQFGSDFIFAEVTIRVRYFFVVTFCLNALCSGTSYLLLYMLRSDRPTLSSDLLEDMVPEVTLHLG